MSGTDSNECDACATKIIGNAIVLTSDSYNGPIKNVNSLGWEKCCFIIIRTTQTILIRVSSHAMNETIFRNAKIGDESDDVEE